MNEIKVVGKVNVNGKEINKVYGGFGEDSIITTVKDIAIVHEVEVKHINELINNNIKRFKENVDYIDLKNVVGDNDYISLLESLSYSKMQISKSKNIYILSERGYGKLIKIMDSDIAWDIYDRMQDEYFAMREIIKSDEQLKKELLYKLYIGGIDSVEAHKKLVEIETKELTNRIEIMQPSVDMAQKRRASDGLYTYTDCQKKFNLKQGQVGCFLKIKGYVHWDKKETTKLGDDTGIIRQYGEEFPNIGVTELGLKFLEDNIDELRNAPCRLPKKKQDWFDMNK